jgi:GGDEF domain-containing protein
VTDRRAILSLGGAIVGILGGSVAAANGAPVAGILAALGALAAGLANAVSRPDPRDLLPAATATVQTAAPSVEPATDELAESITTEQVPSPPVPANATAGFAPPPEPTTPDDPSSLFAPPPPAKVPLLTDPETGLFSEDYFNIAIEARIAAARRHLRPVGVVLLEVIEGLRIDQPRPTNPNLVAEAVRATLREADTASRREDGKFALLLEDTPENGAIWTVERIRRHLIDADAALTVWAGVACYPAHAFDKESIIMAAEDALTAAREWHQDRIEVALGD